MLPRCLFATVRTSAAVVLVAATGIMTTACRAKIDPQTGNPDPDFAWQGEFQTAGRGFQIAALGDRSFRIASYPGGLPGEGWQGTPPEFQTLTVDKVRQLMDRESLQRVSRESPTLGLPPPASAIVLFDGTPDSLRTHWQAGAQLTADGLLRPGATTREKFRDFTLHLEFRTPYQPQQRGQLRGNSGVYLQGRYELQILDSFGWPRGTDTCGAVYQFRPPDLPMGLPPLVWQTYDIRFTMARADDSGSDTPPRFTVRWNGEVIHSHVALEQVTTKTPLVDLHESGPIYLQDHGSPVRFRNIWLLPIRVDQQPADSAPH